METSASRAQAHSARSWVRVTAVVSAAASTAAMLVAAGAIPAAAARYPATSMCRHDQHMSVRTSDGTSFFVKNDNYGGQHECLTVDGRWPNFTVSESSAWTSGHEPKAYPFVGYGCSWGTCSRGSGLPQEVSALQRPTATWDTSQHAGGRWDAAFDIWFGTRPMTTGQVNGGEVMIWLNARGLPVAKHTRVVRLDNTRWYLLHWRACHGGVCWHYVQFRRVRPVQAVRGLALTPFFRHAEAHGWVRPQWWLESIEAGFELWQGGSGLATDRFGVRVKGASPW